MLWSSFREKEARKMVSTFSFETEVLHNFQVVCFNMTATAIFNVIWIMYFSFFFGLYEKGDPTNDLSSLSLRKSIRGKIYKKQLHFYIVCFQPQKQQIKLSDLQYFFSENLWVRGKYEVALRSTSWTCSVSFKMTKSFVHTRNNIVR